MSLVKLSNKNLQEWPALQPDTTDIRIENNSITQIPDSIGELKSLTRIIANNNKISKVSDRLSSLDQFIDLRLADNQLSNIPESVYDLNKLQILILNNNNISLLSNTIGKLTQLAQLHLQDNQIKSLPNSIGNITSLTHLYLTNNPIEYLPPSIEKCTNIVFLELTGTGLPLPPSYNPKSVKESIKYILENQKEPPPELNIKKAFVFSNFSKLNLIEKFENILSEYSIQINVEFENINNVNAIDNSTTVVILIIGFDVHDDQGLVFDIINKCDEFNVPYKIFSQKDVDGIDNVHIEKGPDFKLMRDRIDNDYKQEVNYFYSDEELKGLILGALQQHSPVVKLISLEMENIGHFEKVNVPFDDDLTCIIGENGQGKSSILRALALSIVGLIDNKTKDDGSIKDLLRIKSITQDGKTIYCDIGKIKLNYSLDHSEYFNKIIIACKDEGRVIDIQSEGDFELNASEFSLKSLIVGFPQLRGRINQIETLNKYTQPHIDDLLPLVRNTDDARLDSFVGWIANLYGEAIKSESREETREYATIKFVFEVISSLTGREMEFLTVQQFSPPIVIVSTHDSRNGIPLNLISQGFKIIIGWIGYFIERKVEAFPLSGPENSAKEKSILIIDEIDSSIHPLWQARLLTVLRDKFPDTQIICTTHSPLMVAGLDRNQILEIKNIDGAIDVSQSSFDTWVTTYRDILRYIFDTRDYVPEVTIKELELKLQESDKYPDIQQEIMMNIDRLKENEGLVDDIKRYEQKLEKRERELEELITEYSKKHSK